MGLTFLWVSLLFSMKCCLETGPGFQCMRHLPFWFLVAWKGSSSPKTVRVFSRGRDPWQLLSSHTAPVTAASLSPRGSPPGLSACSLKPAFCQPQIQCRGHPPLKCSRGCLGRILEAAHPARPCTPTRSTGAECGLCCC